MALYLQRFGGSLETGDEFIYGWYADSASSIDAAQGAAVNWISDLLDGAVAGQGLEDLLPTGTVHSTIRTAAIDPATGRQSALRESSIARPGLNVAERSEEHTSELQSLMRISYAVFCLKKKKQT